MYKCSNKECREFGNRNVSISQAAELKGLCRLCGARLATREGHIWKAPEVKPPVIVPPKPAVVPPTTPTTVEPKEKI